MRIVNQILGMQKIYGFQILFCRSIALSSTNSEQSPFLFTPMTFSYELMAYWYMSLFDIWAILISIQKEAKISVNHVYCLKLSIDQRVFWTMKEIRTVEYLLHELCVWPNDAKTLPRNFCYKHVLFFFI